jgi:hypothetical protein
MTSSTISNFLRMTSSSVSIIFWLSIPGKMIYLNLKCTALLLNLNEFAIQPSKAFHENYLQINSCTIDCAKSQVSDASILENTAEMV